MTTPVIGAPAVVTELQAKFAALSAGPDGSNFADLINSASASLASGSGTTSTTATTAAGTTTGTETEGSGTTGGASAVTGDAVVNDAEQYLGVPYKWGGTSVATGFDCSGLTQHVFADLGISIPRTAAEQQSMPGQAVDSISDAQPGDLLFFGSPAHHVGIYMGNGQMLNAPHTGTDVRIEPVYETPTSILRVAGASDTSTAAGTTTTTGVASTGGVSTGVPSAALHVPAAYASTFLSAGAKYDVSPTLLAAVAQTESNYNPNAVSSAGAVGLMQLMPGTAAGLGVDPKNPTQAINGAAQLLSRDITKFGSVSLGLAAYNAGAGAVEKYDGVPPYPETQAYVGKVLSLAGLSV